MVTVLSRYATISVPVEVKKRLEKLKGNLEWGEFLMKLCDEYEKLKREKAFRELTSILSDNDLKRIEEESRRFRKGFVLGD